MSLIDVSIITAGDEPAALQLQPLQLIDAIRQPDTLRVTLRRGGVDVKTYRRQTCAARFAASSRAIDFQWIIVKTDSGHDWRLT